MPDYVPVAFPGASDPQPPRVEISFSWGVTDGSAPENVSVSWQGVLPSDELLLATIDRLAATGNRYELNPHVDEEVDRAARMTDRCERPSCGHPRAMHPRNGPCSFCEESIVCPTFAELPPVAYLHTVDDLSSPTEGGS